MSMDHNYARGKLKLLLRDLSNYNAGEFWREMSRIASGATASIHAEGLKAERDALADSNTQLMQQNEAQISMNAKLMHERDALAAHVEVIERTARLLLQGLANDDQWRPNSSTGQIFNALVHDMEKKPIASLARRDAALKATGIREAVDHILSMGGQTHLGILRHDRYMYISTRELREHADALFQKAEALQ
ncbi:hypothetical protein [Vreelandella nanhaiensis]|uniref:Uncharacterized protein n=1 Tax=Vreelandella nanhaiensis TaxID=1258546 RepID=A0A433KXX6_9GAMM|nr:hypothetical protein [Halomonas nanhaiensis]RUR34509.1 hypothetical protein ELY38_02655 [Halomonas nanhaiensis]